MFLSRLTLRAVSLLLPAASVLLIGCAGLQDRLGFPLENTRLRPGHGVDVGKGYLFGSVVYEPPTLSAPADEAKATTTFTARAAQSTASAGKAPSSAQFTGPGNELVLKRAGVSIFSTTATPQRIESSYALIRSWCEGSTFDANGNYVCRFPRQFGVGGSDHAVVLPPAAPGHLTYFGKLVITHDGAGRVRSLKVVDDYAGALGGLAKSEVKGLNSLRLKKQLALSTTR